MLENYAITNVIQGMHVFYYHQDIMKELHGAMKNRKRASVIFPVVMMAILCVTEPADTATVEQPITELSVIADDAVLNVSRYSAIPRATYRILAEDYEFLRDERFKGVVCPDKIMQLPKSLATHAHDDYKLLKAKTVARKNIIYVIIPENVVTRVREAIKMKRKFYIVYTPVDIYGGFPVVKFVEEIEGESTRAETPEKLEGIWRFYPAQKGDAWSIVIGRNVRIIEYEINDVSKNFAKGIQRTRVPGRPDLDKTADFSIFYDKKQITTIEEGFNGRNAPYKKTDIILQEPLKPGTIWKVRVGNEDRERKIIAVNETVTIGIREYTNVIVVKEDASAAGDGGAGFYAATYYFYSADVGFIGCKIDSSFSKDGLRNFNQIDDWFMQRSGGEMR